MIAIHLISFLKQHHVSSVGFGFTNHLKLTGSRLEDNLK